MDKTAVRYLVKTAISNKVIQEALKGRGAKLLDADQRAVDSGMRVFRARAHTGMVPGNYVTKHKKDVERAKNLVSKTEKQVKNIKNLSNNKLSTGEIDQITEQIRNNII